ncbi:NmrA/HSCARG family protein [Nocardiopsis alba]|uniref:NmrA/HSCARG family protein n=1 Tax=Nocardiopsis alba TaxID=53437 RepID=UPI0033C580F3
MNADRTVLVTGATGNQGGGVARALLADGWRVRAFVRDPGGSAARALADEGAELVRGDWDDVESLRRAVDGVHGVFGVQPLGAAEAELEAEVRWGISLAEIATDAGVEHFVYSSVGGAERRTGIDHFETKAAIERHVLASALPATILRPVFFMNNLLGFVDAGPERVMELPVLADRPMQFIAASDIGRIAAAVFAAPREWIGRQVEIAGDELSFADVARVYERLTGVPTRLVTRPIEDRMFEWFAESGYRADIAALREEFGRLLTFEEFLRRELAGRSGRVPV